jgi:prepilin-type processing-associated H-X9-DG protein
VPNPGSGLTVQLDVAANYVLGHTGESFNGPGGRNEPNSFYSNHVRGVNFVFADGHVQFLSTSVSYQSFVALSTRAGGEVITGDY